MRRFIKMFKNSLIGKILKVIFKVLLWALEILVVFLAIIILTQRLTNDQKTFLGFRIYDVATGSMEPEYAVGDILISREIEPSLIKVGDNIVYMGKSGGYEGKIITHSVIEIERNEKGEYLFHTKGKANTVEDPVVHEDQLYGVIVQNNHLLAFICKILNNRYGLYFFVVIPIIICSFIEFVKVQGKKIEEEREEREQRRLNAEKRKRKSHKKAEEITRQRKKEKIEEIEELEEEPEELVEELEEEPEKKVEKSVTKKKSKAKSTQETKNKKENTAKNTKSKANNKENTIKKQAKTKKEDKT